ncbi:anaerobic ribonucleoside-triphosphate reductase [Desulfurobacterium thermolithotrophum]|uniref:anaerobic ribonucleoside-triphosphate reductase n=1 Tax=Desulfurobacterium thermolithotrophum TaxID=64160 RepID=UPI0013D26758|nr:anaerobic ribonucleoside-triphosphate reductase [Desulfurobacterium thermolithotrophum]
METVRKVKAKIFVNGDPVSKRVFLTSGFQAPFQEGDLLRQIDVNSHFQSYATGGSIFHIFTAEEMEPEEQERLIFNIIKNFPIQYLTKTPFLTTCNKCGHKMVGRKTKCVRCDSEDVTLWSRPIGYFRPVMRGKIEKNFKNAQYLFWLSGRIEDFATRKEVKKKDVEEIVNELSSII